MKIQRKELWYHVLFWVGYFVFNVIRWGRYFDDYLYSIQSNLVEFPIHIVLVYLNIYFLFPKYIIAVNRSYSKYLAYLFSLILLLSIVRILLNYLLVTTEVWPESERNDLSLFDLNYIISVFVGELYVVGTTSAIWFVIEKVKERGVRRQLEREKLLAELGYLKSQIQPHFFFNILNSLYSLALKRSEDTPVMILKLSKIMHFVIYKGKESEIPIIEIVAHIKNYLELEKLRFQDTLQVNFEISGDLAGVYFAPLILSSFVENAVKHGIQDGEGKIPIDISLEIRENDRINFSVRNKKSLAKMENQQGSGGVGLENVMKTLELQYAGRFSFEVIDRTEEFEVKLQVAC